MQLRWTMLAVVICAMVVACDDDTTAGPDPDGDRSPERSSEEAGHAEGDPPDAPDDGDPDGDRDASQRIAALMEQGRSATFHATYEVDDPALGTMHGSVAQDRPRAALWQADIDAEDGRTFAEHVIAEPGSVVSCSWLGDVGHDDIDEWECAREAAAGAALFDVFFGGMLFDTPDYPVHAVGAAGWVPREEVEIAGRVAACGSSPAFAEAVSEVCVDVELGIPVAVERDDASITLVALRPPEEADFDPPTEPWEDADADD